MRVSSGVPGAEDAPSPIDVTFGMVTDLRVWHPLKTCLKASAHPAHSRARAQRVSGGEAGGAARARVHRCGRSGGRTDANR